MQRVPATAPVCVCVCLFSYLFLCLVLRVEPRRDALALKNPAPGKERAGRRCEGLRPLLFRIHQGAEKGELFALPCRHLFLFGKQGEQVLVKFSVHAALSALESDSNLAVGMLLSNAISS